MKAEFGIYTNIGDSIINEDFAGAYEGNISAYVLADGLGGHGGGDIASHIAVDVTTTVVSNAENLEVDLLEECFIKAQEAILLKQKELKRPNAIKTTLVILLTDGKKAMWGHIGDSRLYYCRSGKVKKRTLDHSVPQMLVRQKKIKEKDIRRHPERSSLLKAMGVDWGGYNSFEIDCTGMKIKPGDSFLLCSDGLWDWIEDLTIAKHLFQDKTAIDIVSELGDEAYSNGLGADRDNITALVVKIIQ